MKGVAVNALPVPEQTISTVLSTPLHILNHLFKELSREKVLAFDDIGIGLVLGQNCKGVFLPVNASLP